MSEYEKAALTIRFRIDVVSIYCDKNKMTYWRMQLHPNDSQRAAEHASNSLSAGFIGLDFSIDPGDLEKASLEDVQSSEKPYFALKNDKMQIEDKVLIIVHHFPYALCTVSGSYNYIKNVESELGIWFRHFRRVKDVKYYSDYHTNARNWPQMKMVDTLSQLQDKNTEIYKLIKSW